MLEGAAVDRLDPAAVRRLRRRSQLRLRSLLRLLAILRTTCLVEGHLRRSLEPSVVVGARRQDGVVLVHSRLVVQGAVLDSLAEDYQALVDDRAAAPVIGPRSTSPRGGGR